jgi:hypothetical protein
VRLALALLLLASACQNAGLAPATDAGGGGAGASGGVGGSAGGGAGGADASAPMDAPPWEEGVDRYGEGEGGVDAAGKPPWRPSTCDEPELGQAPNTDQGTVAKLVVGKWLDCGPLSMFQTSDDIGVEIVDDGSWYKLYWTGSDVVRGVGFGKTGTWSAYSGGICCSVSLDAQGAGGGLSFFPAFATSPRKMQVDTSAGGFQTTLATGGN